ncbi:MAG: nitrile hydratase accessory protein [Candidatus Poriferisodalaceae bacterium]|jgi:nitrile hydratase accessory protein
MSGSEIADLPLEGALEGEGAPPRLNGELLFEAPWEARAFGVAAALVERGDFGWQDFRNELIVAIGTWESSATPGADYSYYERWLEALESIAASNNLADRTSVESRAVAYAARPHGHDH